MLNIHLNPDLQSHDHFSIDTVSREQDNNTNNQELLGFRGGNASGGYSNLSPSPIIEKRHSEKVGNNSINNFKIIYELGWLDKYAEIVDL